MSINTAHANGGVLIHAGEVILLFSDNVHLEFHGQDQNPLFRGSKVGRLYLTTHRMVFTNKDSHDGMLSFSFPFVTISDVEIEQPVFGANYIKGKVRAQPNGNWVGEAKFKLMFKKGGAIEFGQAILKTAAMASQQAQSDNPPPYAPPPGPWYQAPPPAYTPSPTGYYGWVPPTHVFPDQPPVNSVFMTDMPPPYPGINAGYNGYASAPPVGFAPPPQPEKAGEAAQSAYYDPNKPQCAYVPPPAYYESPPSYPQNGPKKNN
ncbi:WW domain-binding protein 2 isoform X2 [Bemisia tabaci]|uniref:WW domain-binding protein 2 isoform X2 n=1 Tax=Bemisia tabaci TaxID=7038 RepID=UPI0008F9A1C1|nr:PREDICTED: WW domain-binding protein 2 isoform X2 [Bemisia tabaci]